MDNRTEQSFSEADSDAKAVLADTLEDEFHKVLTEQFGIIDVRVESALADTAIKALAPFFRPEQAKDEPHVTEQSIRTAMEYAEKQGPCIMHGAGYAAHRLVDSEMGAFNAGETLENVLDWFHDGDPREVGIQEMLSRWIAVAILTKYGQHSDDPDGE